MSRSTSEFDASRPDDVDVAMLATLADTGEDRPSPGMSHDDASAALGVGAVDQRFMLAKVASRLELAGAPTLTRIDRFHVIRRLGEGGMGVVYQAYDPDLDRPVAIKLLHPRLLRGDALANAEERMRREARAMARIGHPNVVNIHEVGAHDGQLYLAMEYISGRTLSVWLTEKTRTWRAVLDAFLRAGDGLAAAHAAELVHRDFKPDNVLVSEAGQVKVTDFGLANELDPRDAPTAASEHEALVTLPDGYTNITRTGALMGTPLYMSPEQLLGSPADARSDQFGFAVALYEALVGQRPFAGETFEQLTRSVVRGQLQPCPSGVAAPRWVLKVVERGLRCVPEDRWPSLRAMLDALRDDPQLRRRRWFAAGGVLAALSLTAGAFEAADRVDAARKTAACEAEGAAIETVWNDDARARLRDALTRSNAAHGSTTAEKVIPWIDRYARAWSEARAHACVAVEVERAWEPATRERAAWCLDDKRTALTTLIEAFSREDERAVHRAVTAAIQLPDIASCGERDALDRLPAPPPSLRDQLQPIRAKLTRARTLGNAGKVAEGLELARDATALAEALDWPPLTATAHLATGVLLERDGAYDEAAAQVERAYFEAASSRSLDIEADAATQLAFLYGQPLARHDEGARWTRLAEVAIDELGEGDQSTLRRAKNLDYRALISLARGDADAARRDATRSLELLAGSLEQDHLLMANAFSTQARISEELDRYDEATDYYERALGIRARVYGPSHPAVAQALNNLANVYGDLGDHARAIEMYQRSLDIRERVFGPHNPVVAQSLNNLGIAFNRPGTRDKSRRHHERALAIREQVFGPEHSNVAISHVNLGSTLLMAGDYDAALEHGARALEIFEASLGPEHPHVAVALAGVANIHQVSGHYARAKEAYTRALAVAEKAYGHEHGDVATVLVNLAELEIKLGDLDAAEAAYERAKAIRTKIFGPYHADVGVCLRGLAGIALTRGQGERAITLVEQAIPLLEANDEAERHLATARFTLAQALRLVTREPDRGRALAEAALTVYRRDEVAAAPEIARIEAWLAVRDDA